MNIKTILFLLSFYVITGYSHCQVKSDKKTQEANKYEISKSESEWKKELTPEQYHVLREKGTEYAFTGKYNDFKEKGVFVCAACNNELFDSGTKYNSGSGWPSFYKPLDTSSIEEIVDNSDGMQRIEVVCAKCGGHLGHVFEDGPKPTGLRYCVNSISMEFRKK
jgi:peptide-methionine (R)-S-oxide reductase